MVDFLMTQLFMNCSLVTTFLDDIFQIFHQAFQKPKKKFESRTFNTFFGNRGT